MSFKIRSTRKLHVVARGLRLTKQNQQHFDLSWNDPHGIKAYNGDAFNLPLSFDIHCDRLP